MSDAKKRKVYTAAFKAKVGLEALSEKRTLNEDWALIIEQPPCWNDDRYPGLCG